jgi:PiT family inorganic phosphate transporter
MGARITHIKPMQGFCAELGGAATIFAAIGLGTPISTTHTIAGSIAGVGLARKGSTVRWDVAADIIFAWVLTLPAAGIIAMLVYFITHMLSRLG